MPAIVGIRYIELSVTDAKRSAEWYRALLDMETVQENFNSSNWPAAWNEVLPREPQSGLLIGLLEHAENAGGPFNEFHTDLDHVEFQVEDRDQLDSWMHKLDSLGIPHSGIKKGRILTFRDPLSRLGQPRS